MVNSTPPEPFETPKPQYPLLSDGCDKLSFDSMKAPLVQIKSMAKRVPELAEGWLLQTGWDLNNVQESLDKTDCACQLFLLIRQHLRMIEMMNQGALPYHPEIPQSQFTPQLNSIGIRFAELEPATYCSVVDHKTDMKFLATHGDTREFIDRYILEWDKEHDGTIAVAVQRFEFDEWQIQVIVVGQHT